MKKTLLYFVCSLFFVLVNKLSYGQSFTATYDFVNFLATSGQTDPTTPPVVAGATFGSFTAASTLSANSSAGSRFSFSKWPPGATAGSDSFTGVIDTTKYYSVTITPAAGKSLTLTSMTFTLQRSATGVRQCSVRSSLDTYNSNLPASISPVNSALSVVATNVFQITDATTAATNGCTVTFGSGFSILTAPVTIRFYGINSNGTAGTGTFSIDNVVFTGSTASASPVLTPSVTSLDFGTTTPVGTTSAAQTFTVSGANLTAGATIATAAPYSVSTTGAPGSFSTSATIASAFTSAQTIYVQFSPTATGAAPGTLTINSTGASQQTVNLTGTGAAAVPSLAATPGTLAFGNVSAGTTSAEQSYLLSGSNLASTNTIVTASAPYSISKTTGSGYTTSLTFTPAEIALSPRVYVVFSPTAAGPAPASITNTNALVASGPSVSVTGTGVVPVLTATTTPVTTPTSVDFSNQTISTSQVKSYTLSGTNITGTTTLTSTGDASYTLSKTSGGTYTPSISYTPTELAANPVVYIKFLPTTLGAKAGNIANTTTGTGATTVNVALTGTSVAAPVPVLTVAPTSLTFSSLVGSTTPAQSYTITGANISGATTVTVAAPYSISKTAGGTYGTSLSYTTADFPSGSGVQTVYVQFSPTVVGAGGVNSISAVNATANGSSQSVALNGTGIGVPVLAVAPTSLTFSQVIGTTSAPQSYTLTGTYITGASTVTVAAPYSISKTATGTYGTSLSYTAADFPSGSGVQTVYVQFSPTVIGTTGNTGSALNASAGAGSQSVALNGTGLAVPVITLTPGTLTFSNQSIITPSASQSFSISGANITAVTTVTTAAPFSVSRDNVAFSSSVSFTAAEMATSRTVYVQYAPSAFGTASGTVTVASTGATSQTVTLSGTANNQPPTLAAIADQTPCYNTTQQVIALTGITPGPETATQAVVSVAVTSNNPALFSQLGTTALVGTTSQINYTIANGQSGTALVTVTVKDNGGVANGGTDTYTRTFNITVNPLAVVTVTSDANGDVVEKGNNVQLTATGGVTYAWTPTTEIIGSSTSASITVKPSVTTTYTVTATNASGCPTIQKIKINVTNAKKLVTSNVITPNGDGVNDTWVIQNINLYPANTVKVFNKAGKIVFTQSGYLNTWDGTSDGQPLTQGTYYYVVDLGTGFPYKGYISIVRD